MFYLRLQILLKMKNFKNMISNREKIIETKISIKINRGEIFIKNLRIRNILINKYIF